MRKSRLKFCENLRVFYHKSRLFHGYDFVYVLSWIINALLKSNKYYKQWTLLDRSLREMGKILPEVMYHHYLLQIVTCLYIITAVPMLTIVVGYFNTDDYWLLLCFFFRRILNDPIVKKKYHHLIANSFVVVSSKASFYFTCTDIVSIWSTVWSTLARSVLTLQK